MPYTATVLVSPLSPWQTISTSPDLPANHHNHCRPLTSRCDKQSSPLSNHYCNGKQCTDTIFAICQILNLCSKKAVPVILISKHLTTHRCYSICLELHNCDAPAQATFPTLTHKLIVNPLLQDLSSHVHFKPRLFKATLYRWYRSFLLQPKFSFNWQGRIFLESSKGSRWERKWTITFCQLLSNIQLELNKNNIWQKLAVPHKAKH